MLVSLRPFDVPEERAGDIKWANDCVCAVRDASYDRAAHLPSYLSGIRNFYTPSVYPVEFRNVVKLLHMR